MESPKYSFFNLKIEANCLLEITGARKGLSPFVLDFSIKMGNNQIISDKINLNVPYIQSNTLSLLKSKFSNGVGSFKKKFSIQENISDKILFSMEWKPIDHLAHELLWSITIEIETDKKNSNLAKITGKIGQKKLKNVKKNIDLSNQDNSVFDS
ncbi:MAG: hypothetical protein ACW967_09630, partial [Candidatus Hodarchaeales archaeon]